MEKKNFINKKNSKKIKVPYWRVEYIDDYGYRHLATIIDEKCLKYLQDNYLIINIRTIAA